MPHSRSKDITVFTLRLFAMAAMLCDHLWATVIPGNAWMTWLGRLAFPIFAWLTAEGYCHTRNFRGYWQRMALFALLSELPFNLMYTGSWIFPFHQNVLWTFLLALFCLRSMDKLREKFSPWLSIPLQSLTAGAFALLAQLTMTDYGAGGLLTVVLFRVFRGRTLPCLLGQAAGMFYIHWEMISGLVVPVTLLGMNLEIPQQGFALLALIPIWLCRGRQGPYSKAIRLANYAFYPLHMLILGLLSM